jgi:hypothetical protein
MKQELDMRHASFTTSFNYGDKARSPTPIIRLRQLPFTVLMDVTITAKKDLTLGSCQCNGSAGCPERSTELLQ